MKITFILAIGMAMMGCNPIPAERTLETSNPAVAVEQLAQVDGCTIYRFEDGRTHYFVQCRCDQQAMIEQHSKQVSCGKNCTRTERWDEIISTELAR